MRFFNLLSAGPGAFLYHLFVLLLLEAMVAIALIEWRHAHNPDHRSTLWGFAGLLVLRIPLLLGEALERATLAPLLSSAQIANLVLLGWTFLAPTPDRRARRLYLVGGLGIAVAGVAVFLSAGHRTLAQTPDAPRSALWEPPFWHAVSAILAIVPALMLRDPRRERPSLPALGFVILCLGFAVPGIGSLGPVTDTVGAEVAAASLGLGRSISLASYLLFTIAVYSSALQYLGDYRQELQAVSEESLRQTQELLFLVEASRALGESLDLDKVLHHVLESTTMALNADRSAIFLLNSSREGRVRLAACYTPLQYAEQPLTQVSAPLSEHPVLSYALQRNRPLILNGENGNPRLQALYGLLGGQEAGPTIVQPLIRQRRALGALVVGNDHSQRAFSSNEGRLCRSIATQVAATIENACLYHDMEAQARQLAVLLQQQEEESSRRAAILESVAEGVIISDKGGHIIIVNAAAERILGAPRQRILGRPLARVMGTGRGAACCAPTAQPDTALERVFELENRIVRVNAAPILTPAGDHLGSVAILRDITKETESQRTKNKFVAGVSHELRTPLTAIRGYTEAIRSGMVGAVSEAQAHFLNVILDSSSRMVSLADNLIAVSQEEKGFLKLEYRETDLHLLIGDVVLSFQVQLEERQLEVSLELDDGLPLIEADPMRVRQILDNLVSNAVKFTPAGGHITIGARPLRDDEAQPPTHCAIWVSDTGIGISPEDKEHIWERFYRPVSAMGVEVTGLGVGLSIVKSLTEAHRGRVWLESTPGVGSTFTLLLPIKRHRSQ